MDENELREYLSKTLKLSINTPVFKKVFEEYLNDIQHKIYSNLRYNDNKLYHTHISKISLFCMCAMFVTNYWMFISLFSFVCITIRVYFIRFRRRRKLENAVQDKKTDVIMILRDLLYNKQQEFTEVEEMRAQVLGDQYDDEFWELVKKSVGKDSNVMTLPQIIDGEQIVCWQFKLSDNSSSK